MLWPLSLCRPAEVLDPAADPHRRGARSRGEPAMREASPTRPRPTGHPAHAVPRSKFLHDAGGVRIGGTLPSESRIRAHNTRGFRVLAWIGRQTVPPRKMPSPASPQDPQDLDWSRESSASHTTSARIRSSEEKRFGSARHGRRHAILCCSNALPPGWSIRPALAFSIPRCTRNWPRNTEGRRSLAPWNRFKGCESLDEFQTQASRGHVLLEVFGPSPCRGSAASFRTGQAARPMPPDKPSRRAARQCGLVWRVDRGSS